MPNIELVHKKDLSSFRRIAIGTWETTHTTDPGHTGIVVAATSCADCHDDTLVSAAPDTHNACTSCHDTGTGVLIGSAIGQTGLGDCTNCHSGTWDAEHVVNAAGAWGDEMARNLVLNLRLPRVLTAVLLAAGAPAAKAAIVLETPMSKSSWK